MKRPAAIVVVCSIMFCGCYLESSITKEEVAPNDRKVFFYLKDGSYVRSYSDHHWRVDSGYAVQGTLNPRGGVPKEFTGTIDDHDIVRISVDRYSIVGSAVGAFIVTGLVYVMLSQITPTSIL